MALSVRCLLVLIIFMPARALHAGEIIPPGPTIPVHTLVATLEGEYAGLANQEDPRFGFSAALHGDTLAVGAPGVWASSGVGHLPDRGAVFIYRRNPLNNQWQFHQRIVFPSLNPAMCGYSVALNEHSLLVGCPFHGPGGRAWLFSRPNSDEPFALGGEMFDDDSEQGGAECGTSVALIDGAPGTDSPFPMAVVGCPDRRDFPRKMSDWLAASTSMRTHWANGDW